MTTFAEAKFRRPAVPGDPGSIYYRLVCGGRICRISTDIRLPAEFWDAAARRIIPSAPETVLRLGDRIAADLVRLRRLIREAERSGLPLGPHEIAARFSGPPKGKSVLAFFRERIGTLEGDGRFGTARNYRRTLNSFSNFLEGADLTFNDFSERLVAAYDAYLTRRNVVRNTVSFYMRILRAVYNRAVRMHLAEQTYPFEHVYTGVDRTRKRALDERIIVRLGRADLSDSAALELARDLFIFSYCSRGMAFVDMAYLRKSELRDGTIRYVRRKTGQPMVVRLEPCMQRIIDRHAGQAGGSPYVFPILTEEETAAAYAQYQVRLNYYNRLLKQLSRRIGIGDGLTSYTPRHSWATAARRHRIPLPVISAGMGHTSERTTQIYLASLEHSAIDCANRRIIGVLERGVSPSGPVFP